MQAGGAARSVQAASACACADAAADEADDADGIADDVWWWWSRGQLRGAYCGVGAVGVGDSRQKNFNVRLL
jgi:hypothetical protein